MKKICIFLFGLFLFVILGTNNALASEGLTQEEREILLNEVGLEETDLEILPLEHLRMFIEEDAKVVLEKSEIVTFYESPIQTIEGIAPLGSISEKKLELNGKSVQLSNSSSGQKRFNLYGTWKWITAPINCYVDGMSIGFESGNGIIIPTSSNGKIAEHSHEYATYESGKKNQREYSVYPDDWSPGNGVAALYDIVQGGSGHQGYISQNVYMTQSTGTTNLKFEYAHATTVFNPAFSISKGIFGVTAGTTIDTRDFAATLKW